MINNAKLEKYLSELESLEKKKQQLEKQIEKLEPSGYKFSQDRKDEVISLLHKNKVRVWEVCNFLNVSATTFYRNLNKENNIHWVNQVMNIIPKIKAEKENRVNDK